MTTREPCGFICWLYRKGGLWVPSAIR